MWFVFALICLLSWGGADLFYKKGTNENNRYSHLEIGVCVGLGMGLMAAILLLFTDAQISLSNLLKYTPASAMYILSMIIGYAGLRYLELSIVSPVQNSSGALSAILMTVWFIVTGHREKVADEWDVLTGIGTVIICIGVIGLAFVERKKDAQTIRNAEKKYVTGAKALIFPLLYCLFDTIGTAADGVILDEDTGLGMSELEVLVAYGVTFFVFGVLCYLYLLLRGHRFNPFRQGNQLTASGFECLGQVFYVYAMARNPVVAAPMVGSYCIVSVILSRVFIKEKLNRAQSIVISLVILGIVLLGVAEGIGEM